MLLLATAEQYEKIVSNGKVFVILLHRTNGTGDYLLNSEDSINWNAITTNPKKVSESNYDVLEWDGT